MMPFIHIGPITLASFGLCVGFAIFISYFVLAKDIQRRGIHAPADLLVALPSIAGVIGARLYHDFEDPRYLFAHPGELFSRFGFAWFGGLIAGVAAFVWLARKYRVPLLEMFDAASPAAALGYGLGRIGCLVSGDGDYGKPTSLPWGMSFPHGLVPTTQKVQPTPIYELIVAIFIFWWLWKLGGRQVRARIAAKEDASQKARPKKIAKVMAPAGAGRLSAGELQEFEPAGEPESSPAGAVRSSLLGDARGLIPRGMVFAQYLILTGVARFLVEFIRINPRSFFGLTNAQAASLASILLGVALTAKLRGRGARVARARG